MSPKVSWNHSQQLQHHKLWWGYWAQFNMFRLNDEFVPKKKKQKKKRKISLDTIYSLVMWTYQSQREHELYKNFIHFDLPQLMVNNKVGDEKSRLLWNHAEQNSSVCIYFSVDEWVLSSDNSNAYIFHDYFRINTVGVIRFELQLFYVLIFFSL